MYDTAIYIGRFQPVHNGHVALLRRALECARQVVVVVGSAWQARTPRNPFTWAEREALLRAALPAADGARLTVLPVRDHYDEARWVQAVRRGVQDIVGQNNSTSTSTSSDGGNARIGLVGHFKDATSSYLEAFPGWELIRMERQGSIDATAIRDAYFGATRDTVAAALAPLGGDIPASTLATLERFAHTPHYGPLQEEWRMLRAHRAAWAAAPYPPVFVTVDAVVRCQGHVLLIRRAHAPGRGLLALPGGFIEQRETLWQSCLRELAEETRLGVDAHTLEAALRGVGVFDHPDRSQRGRTITHAHFIDLGAAPLPPVRAGDDAAQAQWTPVAALAALEEELFEDHLHILEHFLGPLAAP